MDRAADLSHSCRSLLFALCLVPCLGAAARADDEPPVVEPPKVGESKAMAPKAEEGKAAPGGEGAPGDWAVSPAFVVWSWIPSLKDQWVGGIDADWRAAMLELSSNKPGTGTGFSSYSDLLKSQEYRMLIMAQLRGRFQGETLHDLELDVWRTPGYTPVAMRDLQQIKKKLLEKIHPGLREGAEAIDSLPSLPIALYAEGDPYPPLYEGDVSRWITASPRSSSGRLERVDIVIRNSARVGKAGRVLRDIARLTTLDAGPTSMNVPYVWGSLGMVVPARWSDNGVVGFAASGYPSHALLLDGEVKGRGPLESAAQVRAILNEREACPMTMVTPQSGKAAVKYAWQKRSSPMDLRGSAVKTATYVVDLGSGKLTAR